MAKVEIELATLGKFQRAGHHRVVNCLAMDDMILICGNDGVLIRVSKGIVRQ